MGFNPYRGWIPVLFEDHSTSQLLSRRGVSQSVAELDDLVISKGDDTFGIEFPQM